MRASVWVLVFSGCCVYWSWEAWTVRIDVDEEGVRWKEGEWEGGLPWEEISVD